MQLSEISIKVEHYKHEHIYINVLNICIHHDIIHTYNSPYAN